MYLAVFSSRALSRSVPIISSAFFQVSQQRRNPLWETPVNSLRTFLSCCISSSRTSPWKHQVIQDVPAAIIQGNDVADKVAFWPERESPLCWISSGITGFLTVCNTCSEALWWLAVWVHYGLSLANISPFTQQIMACTSRRQLTTSKTAMNISCHAQADKL